MWLLNFRKEKRAFYRHPIHLPIDLRFDENSGATASNTDDVSLGGLRFLWPHPLNAGTLVDIDIPVKEKRFTVKGRIAYSRQNKKESGFQTGITFADAPSAFKAKLAEEVLDILEYQKRLTSDLGHNIPEEEAAARWIAEKARSFPA
ncbi:MAG: PilZ domain-containing protein [Candidatus Omnitrophota bacterium]